MNQGHLEGQNFSYWLLTCHRRKRRGKVQQDSKISTLKSWETAGTLGWTNCNSRQLTFVGKRKDKRVFS